MALGINYELPITHLATAAGVRVVMTDYVGLGTPGAHTYAYHREEATAVLDAARAALRNAGAAPDSPVALWGYSQGGGATAAAAEAAATYAPELDIVGTFAGAPPAHLPTVMQAVDGNAIFGVLGMAAAGFAEREPALLGEILPLLNDEGRRYFRETPTMCIPDAILAWSRRTSRELSTTGESFGDIARCSPTLWRALNEQNLGQAAPTRPIMMATALHDDVIPRDQVRDLARVYCGAGTPVTLEQDSLPRLAPGFAVNHALPMFTGLESSLHYLMECFRGAPAPNDCAAILAESRQ
ncbi:alpha/beta fold hydrolase [Corynebacterium sp. zg-331]|uniref:alpha/beta fold hydrolase n=1 Tax=unclassified Corynebacterium TaxID=2624378 RepID=UPI00164269F6|nr:MULTISPECIES: alpha/beta fold hydrolase [unclassified Corynebacterium]MBC3186768.1 alpha/beta fold hydrolase [Corynebacterium sp. zg-331]